MDIVLRLHFVGCTLRQTYFRPERWKCLDSNPTEQQCDAAKCDSSIALVYMYTCNVHLHCFPYWYCIRENNADEHYMYTSAMLESHFAASHCCSVGLESKHFHLSGLKYVCLNVQPTEP